MSIAINHVPYYLLLTIFKVAQVKRCNETSKASEKELRKRSSPISMPASRCGAAAEFTKFFSRKNCQEMEEVSWMRTFDFDCSDE